jgi:hypothetical protein
MTFRPRALIIGVLMAAPAGLALGQGAPAARSAMPAPEVDLTVVAPKDPKVLSTFPKSGSVVPGGSVVLKIVFDQAMTPEAWSYSPLAGAAFPACLARPRLLNDRRTFALLCSLPTKTAFALQVNAAPHFVSAGGRKAPAFQWRFSTSEDVTISLHDALSQAGLGDADDPIMSPDQAAGAVQSSGRPRPAAIEEDPAGAATTPAPSDGRAPPLTVPPNPPPGA